MITIDDLKTAYGNALIMQYRTKPRALATVKALTSEVWLDGLAIDESECFNLDEAVGAQLDVIGRIVGVNRNIFGLDLAHDFFEMTTYSGSPVGVDMQRYSDSPSGPEIMLRYNSDATYTMSDFEMRYLIKLKIIFNTTQRTLKALIDSFYLIFGSSVVITDNLDMTMDYDVSEPYHNVFTVAEYLNIIPKPMAVAVTVNYV